MIRNIIKIHGGKFYIRKWILSFFPEDYEQYVESFCGGCSVLLGKSKSPIEVINDKDISLYTMYKAVKEEPENLKNTLRKTEYSLETFECYKNLETEDMVSLAAKEIILRRMSRGGMKKHFATSNRMRGGRMGDLNAWENFKSEMDEIFSRFEDVIVENKEAISIIQKYDNNKTVHYVDPTYLPSTRTVSKVYSHEMSEKDHESLAETLNCVKGKVILSGYYSPLYNKIYKGWNFYSKEMPNHSSQGKSKERRLECLWMNF